MPPITIQGEDNPVQDAVNIQNAVNNPAFNPITLQGRFNFGGGWDGWHGGPLLRKTVVITRAVTIQGPAGKADIIGGGAKRDSMFGIADSGPFKLEGNAGHVIFERLRFSGWKGEAILAEACQGLTVRDCEFKNPAPGTAMAFGSLRFVHAVLAGGPRCTGPFIATGNYCDLMNYANDPLYAIHPRKRPGATEPSEPVPIFPTPHLEPLADDEQLLACVLTNFNEIRITDNQIFGHDEGIEVISNLSNQTLEISDNIMTLVQTVGAVWGGPNGHFGIVCCKNKDAVITNNTITITGPGSGLVLSGEGYTVTGNTVSFHPLVSGDLNTYPVAGFLLGSNIAPQDFPTDLGPSIIDSSISNNTLIGMAKYGIKTFDAYYDVDPFAVPVPPANDSHNNAIENNSLWPGFRPIYASLFLGSGTHDNTCIGMFPVPTSDRPGVIDEGVGNNVTVIPIPRISLPRPIPVLAARGAGAA